MTRGKFITFEGNDGVGKSTQAALLQTSLGKAGINVHLTREPGGTELGERLRAMVLHESSMDQISETLLMFAARREHLRQKIAPELDKGDWVICDRFTDSTTAYQGGGRGVAMELIAALTEHVQGREAPDLTFCLHAPLQYGNPLFGTDAFERENMEFHRRVASAYEQLARQHPKRIVRIRSKDDDGTWHSREEIGARIWAQITQRLLPAAQ